MRNKIILLLILCLLISIGLRATSVRQIFVSPSGLDTNTGLIDSPLQTIEAALNRVRKCEERAVEICLRGGVYHLSSPVVISPELLAGRQLLVTAWNREKVIISGSKELHLKWRNVKNTLWKAPLDEAIDRLWIGGEQKVMARYPNYRPAGLFHGTSAEALSKDRIRHWKQPAHGFIHAMHGSMWGSQHYEILGKATPNSLIYRGGYQISRPSPLHKTLRYVENIREELDTLNEWFWDRKAHTLYYYARPEEDLTRAEGAVTSQLIIVRGTAKNPIQNVTIRGIIFTKTRRTFMEPYETLLRSDWRIFRGAALFMEHTKNCHVIACEFKDLGGNALFISKYAYNDTIRSNHFQHIGSSAVCLVGDTSAVRSGSYGYTHFVPYEKMDLVPGAKNNLYPSRCVVEDNLIHDIGLVEKQVAGVEMQITALNEVRHNTIYDVPRAGINIGDGAFGGHIIEYNDVFNTVLETGDHGAFNAWGRDRFWLPDYEKMVQLTAAHPELILKDALYTTLIRYNRFRCDHGWDIDLDDGSSNYHIYNNVCLKGGIKLREGFYRRIENNIVINNSLHPHVWFPDSRDVVRRNVFMQAYHPIAVNYWGEEVDYNFFATAGALQAVRKNGTDRHSRSGEISFSDSKMGIYTVENDEVSDIGFQNFPQDSFGVLSSSLKEQAERPAFPALQLTIATDNGGETDWQGMKVRSVNGLGDRSAFGLPDEKGVIIVSVRPDSPAYKAGFREKDVIREVNGVPIASVENLHTVLSFNRQAEGVTLQLYRHQQAMTLRYVLRTE